ncbi:hypothetical protein QJS10_CPB20g01443 [Acorus calamus]|uniref:Uncharacterized protein n=1 Tax=Acorus calamus TaxID=4465 RepID=A0AAV9C8B4_ACOCL|nr:hypothetical protein QJS10_CPB20g01443 [Acorus calamus]
MRDSTPSLVTRACDPSGGINVTRTVGPVRRRSWLALSKLASCVTRSWRRLGAAWRLEWRGPRKAGFTEQRTLPALNGGRTTSLRTVHPSSRGPT